MALIEGLFVYPVKSARGTPLSSARITETGFEWDRQWMTVNAGGEFLTQRTQPKLATLVPKLTSDTLELSAPGFPTLSVPLGIEGAPVSVRIWDDTCAGEDQGDEVAEWLTEFMGSVTRLVRAGPPMGRLANAKYAGPYPVPVAFPDGYPVLVCNTASLESLNRRMPEPIPMERFRPNVVLGGLTEFAEDRIETLSFGDVVLRLVKPCIRCIITSTDQKTGERSTNPLPVLRKFRFDKKLLGVKFGENAVISAGIGSSLEVGQNGDAVDR